MTSLFNRALGLALVTSVAAVAAPAAGAAVLQGDPRGGLAYVAQPGEANDVTVEWRADELRLRDAGARIELRQRGVEATAVGDHEVRIRPPVKLTVIAYDGKDAVRIGGVPTDGVSVDLGEGDDLLDGGPGRDFADGGPGRDTLAGNAGDDRLVGGLQRDALSGGAGADALLAEGDFVQDAITGGEGADTATAEPGEALDASIEKVTRAAFLPILRPADAPAPARVVVDGRTAVLEPGAIPAAGVYTGVVSLRVGDREIGRFRWQDRDAGDRASVKVRLGRLTARRVHRYGRLNAVAVHRFDDMPDQLAVSERVRLVSGAAASAGAAVASAAALPAGVVAANAHARVVRTARGTLVAESLVTGRRTVLGTTVPASLVDLDRNMVGYARQFSNRVEVRSIDARTGKVARSSATENVMALQVRRTGTLVWIAEHGTTRSVHFRTFPADGVLGTGERIDPRSLALADSDATTVHVFWVDGRTPHVAAIE